MLEKRTKCYKIMLEKWKKQYKIVLEKWTNAEKYCWNNVYNQAFYKSFQGDILFE